MRVKLCKIITYNAMGSDETISTRQVDQIIIDILLISYTKTDPTPLTDRKVRKRSSFIFIRTLDYSHNDGNIIYFTSQSLDAMSTRLHVNGDS